MVECAMDQGVCKFNVNTEVRADHSVGHKDIWMRTHMDEEALLNSFVDTFIFMVGCVFLSFSVVTFLSPAACLFLLDKQVREAFLEATQGPISQAQKGGKKRDVLDVMKAGTEAMIPVIGQKMRLFGRR
jgi:fructose/tagatose bisphosphate aldolase